MLDYYAFNTILAAKLKKKKYLDVKMSPQSVRPLLRKFAIKLANPNNSYKVEFKFCVGCHYHNDIYK